MNENQVGILTACQAAYKVAMTYPEESSQRLAAFNKIESHMNANDLPGFEYVMFAMMDSLAHGPRRVREGMHKINFT